MSISAADVLAAVNDRLSRSETSVDDELKAVLVELAQVDDFLEASSTVTTSAGTQSYSVPSDFKRAEKLSIVNGNVLTRISWDDYRARMEDTDPVNAWDETETYGQGDQCTYGGKTYSSLQDDNLNHQPDTETSWWQEDTSGRGEPQEWTLRDDQFYFWPVPDAIYTISVEYFAHHAESTTVSFPDRFRECIYCGVTAAVAAKYQLLETYSFWRGRWAEQVRILREAQRPVYRSVRYRDL